MLHAENSFSHIFEMAVHTVSTNISHVIYHKVYRARIRKGCKQVVPFERNRTKKIFISSSISVIEACIMEHFDQCDVRC